MNVTVTIYLAATPEQVWRALTDPEHTAVWWEHRNVSGWAPGNDWKHLRLDQPNLADIAGTVLTSRRPLELTLTWANPEDGTSVASSQVETNSTGPASEVNLRTEAGPGICRLAVTHRHLGREERDPLTAGWVAVLSNLKTYLETGRAMPQAPWLMLPGFVRPPSDQIIS